MTQEKLDKNAEVISGMFDSIAGQYDAMNHWLSLGIDRLWRRRFVRTLSRLVPAGADLLDLACGTGDLTQALARKGFTVKGLDISAEMMAIGQHKCRDCKPLPQFMLGSAEQIPFPDHSFDAVTVSFGLRNFDHRPQCLAEIRRVLKPGGRLAVLEFAVPRNRLWRALYLFYFKHATRLVGHLAGRAGAYGYFVDSVLSFPCYEALCAEFQAAGFTQVRYRPYTGGIACAYWAAAATPAAPTAI